MRQVVVWYEDSRSPRSEGADFGPHDLLVSCLADEFDGREGLHQEFFRRRSELKRHLGACPLNGNGALLKRCRQLLANLDRSDISVAVFDFDRVHELLPPAERGAARSVCKRELRRLLVEPQVGGRPSGQLHVTFLVENTESLLAALPSPPQKKPDPAERDRLLRPVWSSPDRMERNRLRRVVPSFDYIVKRVEATLATAGGLSS